MRKLKLLSIIPMLLLVAGILSACGKNPTPIKKMDFEPNNGSAVITIEYQLNTDIIPPNPSKNGFAFDGWFWDDGVWSKPFTINSILDQPLQQNMNLKVYAKWNNKNTIIFNSNGGSGTMENQVITENTSASLTANAFTRENWSFQGWATTSSGSVVYSNEAIFNMTENGGTTLYAVWSKILVTVTFNKNDGGSDLYSQQIQINTDTVIDANMFTRTGYSFMGWATSSAGDVVYENGAMLNINTNLPLYAVWQVNGYIVSYHSNNGQSQTAQQNVDYGNNITLFGQNAFVRASYTLIKWNTQANGGGTDYAASHQFDYLLTNNLTLYAIWQLNENEGGDGTENSPYIFKYVEQIINFANQVNSVDSYSLGKYYALENNIDLDGIQFDPIGFLNTDYADFTRTFQGNFDGRGYKISNFTINARPSIIANFYLGLFGYIRHAEIKNLGTSEVSFINVSRASSMVYVGGLVGYSNSSSINGCYTSSNISMTLSNHLYVGGLIGYNESGIITDCFATGNISSVVSYLGYCASYAGGLVGYNSGNIINSFATGNISSFASTVVYNADSHAGGLVGQNATGNIKNSLATGNVSSISEAPTDSTSFISNVGGIAGTLGGSIDNCYRYEGQAFYRKARAIENTTASNNFGLACTLVQLNNASFYTLTLGWNSAVWDLSDLDYANRKLPTLKMPN